MSPLVERVARKRAAKKMGLINDSLGERLPDELWRQAAPEAERFIHEASIDEIEAELGGNEAYKEAGYDLKSITSNYSLESIKGLEAQNAELVAVLQEARRALHQHPYNSPGLDDRIAAALAARHPQGRT
jgi:hypothetical protein